MEDGHHLFISEGILSRQKLKFLIIVGTTPFLLWWSIPRQLDCHRFFPFGLGRLGCITSLGIDPPLVLGHWGLKLFSWFLACLCLFKKVLPSMRFDSSHMNFYSVEELVSARLKQHGQGHASRAHKGEIAEPFNVFARIFLLSESSRGAYLWSPRCRPHKIEKRTRFPGRSKS